MYAIFEDGSHQYRVSVGDTVRLDHREAEVGSSLELGTVLLVADGADALVGQPLRRRGPRSRRGDRSPVHQVR